MSNLTTLPKGDSAWLLRKSIQRIMQQVSVLETNIGSSTTGNSANTQIIFNDNGVLRGDAGLTYNATTDLLIAATLKTLGDTQLANIGTLYVGTIGSPKLKVDVAGTGETTIASATITGDLTVDTNVLKVDTTNNRVGIGTASPANVLTVRASDTFVLSTGGSTGFTGYSAQVDSGAGTSLGAFANSFGWVGTSTNHYLEIRANNIAQQKIEPLGVFTWYDGAGGTRMTLNANGLGVGVSPLAKLDVVVPGAGSPRVRFNGDSDNPFIEFQRFQGTASNFFGSRVQGMFGGMAFWVSNSAAIGSQTFTQAMTLDASGNLLVGRTTALGGKIGTQVEGGNGAAYLLRHNAATAGKYRIFAIDSTNNGLFYDQNNVGMYMADAGTSWIATSDETQKDIIEPISNAASKVGSLRAVIGKFKTDANSVRRPFLIAQDVQTALPEAVHQKDGLLGLSYTDVIPLLVAAIKELTARVQTLEAK